MYHFADQTSHHHLVCEACGTIEDLHHDFPGVVLPAPAAEGFEVNTTEIVFRGRCASCAANQPPTDETDDRNRGET